MAGFRQAGFRTSLTITKRSDGCFTSPPRARRRTCTSSIRRSMSIEDPRQTAPPHSRASSNPFHHQFFHTPHWRASKKFTQRRKEERKDAKAGQNIGGGRGVLPAFASFR